MTEVYASPYKTIRDVAVMLATKQLTGTATLDDDIWAEEISSDDQQEYMETAAAIVNLVKTGAYWA